MGRPPDEKFVEAEIRIARIGVGAEDVVGDDDVGCSECRFVDAVTASSSHRSLHAIGREGSTHGTDVASF